MAAQMNGANFLYEVPVGIIEGVSSLQDYINGEASVGQHIVRCNGFG